MSKENQFKSAGGPWAYFWNFLSRKCSASPYFLPGSEQEPEHLCNLREMCVVGGRKTERGLVSSFLLPCKLVEGENYSTFICAVRVQFSCFGCDKVHVCHS